MSEIMKGHTAGKWTVNTQHVHHHTIIVCGREAIGVAYHADVADLWAAAPLLLEALKEARGLIANLLTDMRMHPDAIAANAIVARIDSAIAAATMET